MFAQKTAIEPQNQIMVVLAEISALRADSTTMKSALGSFKVTMRA
jgi:hypothetical protein